jgi:hypothetical protein
MRYRPREDPMLQKARKLLETHRVEFLGNDIYNVIGDHGTYSVAVDYTGKISCNCQGFLSKGKCSHAQAVAMRIGRRAYRGR